MTADSKHQISLVVATKDRPADLRVLLRSLSLQSTPPVEIIVVDGGKDSVETLLDEFPRLNLRYVVHQPPSAAAQRNAGISLCNTGTPLIGFADDDAVFEPDSFEHMLKFWADAAANVLGAAFNMRNFPDRRHSHFKGSRLSSWLGLYSPEVGRVSKSGWQTVIPFMATSKFVEWLPSGAVVFRREVVDSLLFDPYFSGYSYLEDLDFSYSVSRRGKLMLVADAMYSHFPSISGRVSAQEFGTSETRNRLYFVRKHNLSVGRCYMAIVVRCFMTIATALVHRNYNMLLRAYGNILGIFRVRSASGSQSTQISETP